MKRWILATCIAFSGCTMHAAVSQRGILILKPQITNGQLTQTTITPYDKAAIQHLTLKLFIGAQDTGLSKTLLNAQLDNPMVFSNLKANTTYRVKAYAYASSDDSILISLDDSNSWTDIALTDDERPTVENLKVKLIDRAFSGIASSSLVVYSGGYSAIASESLESPKLVSTVAGNGTAAFADGLGSAARLSSPLGVAADTQGILYVSDASNNRIRKIYPSGLVITLAGNASASFTDGTGTAASLNFPCGIAVDSQGNLYVGDRGNNRVRKITPTGVVSTFAGSGSTGLTNGVGTSAVFNGPDGIDIDNAGNLYVVDGNNCCIRKILPNGTVSTLAGNGIAGYQNGLGTSAMFNSPVGIALDSQGNIFVGDQGNHTIRKITPTGDVSTFAGNGTGGYVDGIGTAARFNTIKGIAIDSHDNALVADRGNQRIRKITPNGMTTTIAGNGSESFADGTGTSAMFQRPYGIGVDALDNIYVTEWTGHRVRKLQ